MNCSQTITKISIALVKAQSEMGNAKKDAKNPFFKSYYADLNSVREVTIPALNAQGITALQPTTVIDGISYVETVLLHESGEYISSLTPIIADKINNAQSHGSGLTYARRYALQSICNVGAEDDDAEKAVTKIEPKKDDTEKNLRELNANIAKLSNCNNIDELKTLKSIVPDWVVKNKDFVKAANERFLKVQPQTRVFNQLDTNKPHELDDTPF